MRRALPIAAPLAALVALALAGCASARRTTTATAPAQASAFPVPLPAGTVLAYAVRQTPLVLSGIRRPAATASTIQTRVLGRARTVAISCRTSAPPRALGTISSAQATAWARLLDAGHVASARSDPVSPTHRGFWFARLGRVVDLDFARHVRRAPCTGTDCAAALHIDSTLAALEPAMVRFGGLLAAHCPPA